MWLADIIPQTTPIHVCMQLMDQSTGNPRTKIVDFIPKILRVLCSNMALVEAEKKECFEFQL